MISDLRPDLGGLRARIQFLCRQNPSHPATRSLYLVSSAAVLFTVECQAVHANSARRQQLERQIFKIRKTFEKKSENPVTALES